MLRNKATAKQCNCKNSYNLSHNLKALEQLAPKTTNYSLLTTNYSLLIALCLQNAVELVEEANIVLEVEAQILHTKLQHCDTLNTHTEGKA